MRPVRIAVLALSLLPIVACSDDPTRVLQEQDGVAPHRSAPNLSATMSSTEPATYFAPRTVVRETGRASPVEFPLDDRPYSRFMEPFVLHLEAAGEGRVAGEILVDGVPVVSRRELAGLGGGSLAVEIPVGPTSVLTVALQGRPGGAVTFRVEAPLQPPPVITITSAERGAMLAQGSLGPSPVEVSGTACHPHFPITELEIAGVAVPVAGDALCEPFTVVQESRWGMSTVTGFARNSRGREGRVVQSYLRSPDYFPLVHDFDPTARAPLGLFTQLNHDALDDDDRSDIDDVATLLELGVNQVGLDVGIPDPVIPCSQGPGVEVAGFNARQYYQLDRGAVGGEFAVNWVEAFAGAIEFDVYLLDFEIPLSAELFNPEFVPPTLDNPLGFVESDSDCSEVDRSVEGTVTVDTAQFRITVEAAVASGGPFVTATTGDVSLTDLEVAFERALPTLVVNAAVDFFNAHFIEATLESFLEESVGALTEDILDDLTEGERGERTLNGATFGFASGLESLAFLGGGAARIGQFAQVVPLDVTPSAPTPTRGALRAGGPAPTFSQIEYTFGVAVHQDVLNQALWSAWASGAFAAPDVTVLPGAGAIEAASLSVEATLPPVSMARAPDDPMFEIAWGGIHVLATVDPADLGEESGEPIAVEAWLGARVTGTLALDEEARRLLLPDADVAVDVQLVSPVLPFDETELLSLLVDDLRGPLVAMAEEALGSVRLPALILDDMPGVPPGTELKLRDAVLERDGFYYRGTGVIR